MSGDPMGTWVVTVESHGLSEKGWHTMLDAIEDLDMEAVLNDAVVDALGRVLPEEASEGWGVSVKEQTWGEQMAVKRA